MIVYMMYKRISGCEKAWRGVMKKHGVLWRELNEFPTVYRPSPHLATRIKVLLDLSIEFRNICATGSGEASDTPPSLPTTSIVEPKSLEVRGLPCFDHKGEPTTLSVRWKRWKRAFHLYVASKGVTNEAQKVALLLHSGGMDLQEIFYTLAQEDETQNNFDNCLTVLDNYFTPKANVPFERHESRQLAQLNYKVKLSINLYAAFGKKLSRVSLTRWMRLSGIS